MIGAALLALLTLFGGNVETAETDAGGHFDPNG